MKNRRSAASVQANKVNEIIRQAERLYVDKKCKIQKSQMGYNNQALTVNAAQAAQICGLSVSHWIRMDGKKLTPSRIKGIGKRRLWLREEIERWVKAKMPNRSLWEQIKLNLNESETKGDIE